MASIDTHAVSIMAAVPAMVKAMLDSPSLGTFDLTSLRYSLIGGAPIPRPLVEALEARTGLEVLEGYGLSETSPVIAFRTPAVPRAWGSVGRPIDGVDMVIAGEDGDPVEPGTRGEVVVKGDPVMKGYLHAPELTTEAFHNGWFRTGDIGYMDASGNLFLVDRKKDVILRGGYTVYPAEVEEALLEHPAIGECSVVGAAHESLGEEVVAHVVLTRRVDEPDLIQWSRARMAAFKYPRHFVIRESLPRGTKGQVLKHVLRNESQAENTHAGN
jgi:long-chain acyl-CoA synthetase